MEDDRTSGAKPAQRLAADPTFAEFYHRHFADVYDYAIRLTRDREIAALVVQASFLRVLQEESYIAADAPNAKKLQLFSAAHHDAVERVRQQRGVATAGDEDFALVAPAADTGQANDAVADDMPLLAGFAWQVASALRLNDYEILDLSVRRGLEVEEIAAVLRIRPQAVGNKLQDVHDAFEAAYATLLVYERGRRVCVDLDFLVGGDEWSPALQRRIRQHLKTCHTCGETRSEYDNGGQVIAALTPVAAPAGWEQTILERLQKADIGQGGGPLAGSGALTGGVSSAGAAADGGRTSVSERRPAPERARGPRGGADPFPTRYGGGGGGELGDWIRSIFGDDGPRGPLMGAAIASLITAALLLGGLCVGGAFDGGGGADGAPTPSPTITGTPDGSATATQTATATATATPTGEIDVPTAPPAPTGTAAPRPTSTATIPFPTSVPTPTLEPAPTETPDSQGGGAPTPEGTETPEI